MVFQSTISSRKRRQFVATVAENGDCRRIWRLSPETATVDCADKAL